MNRVIKFRAWDGKKWVDMTEHALRFHETNKAYLCAHTGDIIPVVLSQFTGLHDKNGKEIYEGDVVKATFRSKDGVQAIMGEIIMDEFMWCLDFGEDMYSINRIHDVEIIGNCYENPDLIA